MFIGVSESELDRKRKKSLSIMLIFTSQTMYTSDYSKRRHKEKYCINWDVRISKCLRLKTYNSIQMYKRKKLCYYIVCTYLYLLRGGFLVRFVSIPIGSWVDIILLDWLKVREISAVLPVDGNSLCCMHLGSSSSTFKHMYHPSQFVFLHVTRKNHSHLFNYCMIFH